MSLLLQISVDLYMLFKHQTAELASQTGFIRRVRGFTASEFLQTLTFGWLANPETPLEHLAGNLGISRQALHKHLDLASVAFSRAALLDFLKNQLRVPVYCLPKLRRFAGLFVDDCSQFVLPDSAAREFPSCNLATKGHTARLKLFLRWELQGGALIHLSIHPGRLADIKALELAPDLPKGSLHLVDLGFIDFDRMQRFSDTGIYWISRVPVQTRLFLDDPTSRKRRPQGKDASQDPANGVPLWQQLRKWRKKGTKEIDLSVRLGEKTPVSGRLVARVCPAKVVAKRKKRLEAECKRRGTTPSERLKEMCRWQVHFTNVVLEWLTAEDVRDIYRLRWQIELLIKKLKSEGRLGKCRSGKSVVAQVELYLKLLAQAVRNRLELLHGGPLRNVNRVELGRVIGERALELRGTLEKGLTEVYLNLEKLQDRLKQVRARTKRKKNRTAAERWGGETPS